MELLQPSLRRSESHLPLHVRGENTPLGIVCAGGEAFLREASGGPYGLPPLHRDSEDA